MYNIANYSSLLANGEITIGNNVLIGPNVVVSSGYHIVQNGVLLKESRNQAVIIGENSWISANCTIVGGNSCQNNPCCWRSMGGKHNET